MKIRMGKVTDCFLSSYTKDGYRSFFAEEAGKMRRIILLKGASMQIRSGLYKALAQQKTQEGCDVELVHHAGNAEFLEGIIFKADLILLADHDPQREQINSEIFDLTAYLDEETYAVYEAKIRDLEEQIRVDLELLSENCPLHCRHAGAKSEADHQEQQKILREMADELFFRHKSTPHVRFAQGSDRDGRVDYYQDILKEIGTKQYLSGDNWPDKSRVLEYLAQEAGRSGCEATLYYDSWDYERAELLVVPESGLALAADKLGADFRARHWAGRDTGYPRDIKKLLAGVNRLQTVLEEIYSDVLPHGYPPEAWEDLQRIIEGGGINGG